MYTYTYIQGERGIEFLEATGLGKGMYRIVGWASLPANMKGEDVQDMAERFKALPDYERYFQLTWEEEGCVDDVKYESYQ